MSTQIRIKFIQPPKGLTEAINSSALEGILRREAEKIAAEAGAMLEKGQGFAVQIRQERRGKDAIYGAYRPVAYVLATDAETAKEEAENKVLSKAVHG